MKLALVVLLAACNNEDEFVCHAPEKSYYDCQPIDASMADAKACVGGPAWRPTATNDSTPLTYQDPALVFPEHCMFHLDECGCCSETGRLFECYTGQWEEPL